MRARIWRTFPLSRKAFDEESVIFNRASGSTHLINPVADKILSVLEQRPSSAQEISEQVSAEIKLDPDEEIIQRVELVLETLDRLGLVEPLPQ
ncbi:MAG: HPr-rel-A system PqqD family peptide chaperone [Alphaproteobacteria bacterium]